MIADLTARASFRYPCVGATCALTNWGLMLLIDERLYAAASILLFVPIGTLGFLLHACWTFRARPTLRGWITYLAAMLPGFPLSLGLLSVLHDLVGCPLWSALPSVTVIMTTGNFFVSRWAILPRRRAAAPKPAAACASTR